MKIVSSKPTITRKELEKVLDCMINNELTTGGTVKNLELSIADMCGFKYSLATNSITSAYHLIFSALQIDENSEIIMPSFIDQSPLSALSYSRGKAILVDNDENSPFPSIEEIKSKINKNTKAIIINHTFGFHMNPEPLQNLNIPIIENISNVIGTDNNELPVGKNSTFAILSFSPSMIITTGNGGMVLTNHSKYFSSMRDLRGRYADRLNLDYTMTDLQGAMGVSQMTKLKSLLKRRREIGKIYSDAIKLTPHKPLMHYNENFTYQSFPLIFDASNEKTLKFWKKNGIEIFRPLEFPLHVLLNMRGLDYPNTDRLSKKLLAIPLYPTLTKKEIEKITKTLSSFI